MRRIARRLPVTGGYERRIAALTADVHRLAAQVPDQPPPPPTWAPQGHFYSPIPDPAEVRADHDRIFGRDPTDLPGIDLHLDDQWALLDRLAPLADDVDLAPTASVARAQGERYWTDNPGYPADDALALTMLLRDLRPSRLVELGSGFSSACTLDVRERHLDGRLDITFVDPYPAQLEELRRDDDRSSSTLIAARTQDVDLDLFRGLAAGDVLFVDSTHVSRAGSDVNHIVFEILPVLAPGVLVHVHDVFPGFEYPVPWVMEGRAWTEQYVLRAFLQHNDRFRVHWWPSLLRRVATEEQRERYPVLARLQGGAIWLRAS